MKTLSVALFTIFALLLSGRSYGQEVLISDSAAIPPFQGVIGYRIRYEGKVNPASKPYLADSMTLFVGKNGLLYTFHGGNTAEMESKVLWDGDTQSMWLIDAGRKTAQYQSEYYTGYVATAKKTTEKLRVAGKSCNAWTLTHEKQVEKVWVNDSIYFGGKLVDSLKLQQPEFLAAGLRKIPLQARRPHAEEVVTVLQAMTIKPGPQDPALFKVPEGYRLLEFDPSELLHPILAPKSE